MCYARRFPACVILINFAAENISLPHMNKKLNYLCPQADALSLDSREFICQSGTDVNLGSENIFENIEVGSITWESIL